MSAELSWADVERLRAEFHAARRAYIANEDPSRSYELEATLRAARRRHSDAEEAVGRAERIAQARARCGKCLDPIGRGQHFCGPCQAARESAWAAMSKAVSP